MRRLLIFHILLVPFLLNCAYFNTYYLAQKNFKDAEDARIKAEGALTADATRKYREARKWSIMVFNDYRDSKWVDNSLEIIGKSSFHLREYNEAIIRFDNLIELFPESPSAEEAKLYKAKALIKTNRFEEAVRELTPLLNSTSRSIRGRAGVQLAEIRNIQENWALLLETSRNTNNARPERTEFIQASLLEIKALYNLEMYEECRQAATVLFAERMSSSQRFELNTYLARSLANLDKTEEALSILQSMEGRGEFARHEPGIRIEIGKIYEINERPEVTIEYYRRLAGDYPDSIQGVEAWYRIGKIHLNDISKVQDARDAFANVGKGRAKSTESWFVDASIKTAQIDSMHARLDRISKIEDDPENLARTRFSLAELYGLSFGRTDWADEQYNLIISESPGTEQAVMSEFYLKKNELEKNGMLDKEAETELMERIILSHPGYDFTEKLKLYLNLEEEMPDLAALRKAENAKYQGEPASVYVPLFQAVVDSFPGTRNAGLAMLVLAHTYEHEMNMLENALEIYNTLASMPPDPRFSEYSAQARRKLDFYSREAEFRKDILQNLAYYNHQLGKIETAEQIAEQTESVEIEEFTGFNRIRARNAGIRSRYYTD